MKLNKLVRVICVLLVAVMALSFVACGGDDEPADTTKPAVTNTPDSSEDDSSDEEVTTIDPDLSNVITTSTKTQWEGETVDLGGATVTFLNSSRSTWEMVAYFTFDNPEDVGVTDLDQKIWQRQTDVQTNFNCVLKENNQSIYDLNTSLSNDIVNDLKTFDVAYQRADQAANMIVKNYYVCLDDIDTIDLDKSYWTQQFLEDTELYGMHYLGLSNLNLIGFESVWTLFFNAKMLDEKTKLARPYDLVNSGDWTWNELSKYCEAARNLNGADSYTYDKNARTVYGMSSFVDGVNKFIYGMNGLFADKDEDGAIVFHGNEDAFQDICLEVAYFMQNDGRYIAAAASTGDPSLDYYIDVFKNERSLFLGAELKTAQSLRQLEWEYGILPYPKANPEMNGGVKQENYMSTCFTYLPVLTIPNYKTREDGYIDNIGTIVDVLSWASDQLVLDSYYNTRVSLQGLKSLENIKMLSLIKNSRGFDIFVCYGFSESMIKTVCDVIHNGGGAITSTIKNGYENEAKAKIENLENYILELIG